MTAKKMFITFTEAAFFVLLIGFALFYIILGDRLKYLQEIMKALLPAAIYLVMFYVSGKLKMRELDKRRSEGRLEFILRLTVFDKIKGDAATFGIPMLVLLIAYLFKQSIYIEDIAQSVAVFSILKFWHKYLFNKE